MKKVPFSQLLIVLCFVGLFSCGSKDVTPGCSSAWTTETQDELDALSKAASAYGSDQSQANCTAYKNAYSNYLKALRSFSNCSLILGSSRKALDEAIKEAEDEIKTLC